MDLPAGITDRRAQRHDAYCSELASLEPDARTLVRSGRLMADGLICEEGVEDPLRPAGDHSEHAASTLQRVLMLDLWATSLDD